jgi:hypothetical protein
VGAAAAVARYMAARVRACVRVDGGGDAGAVALPLPSRPEAACWTALQVECTISSEALKVALAGGAEWEAGHKQTRRGSYTLSHI